MPARRQAFLSRPRETIFVLCPVQEGARNPNSAPPPAMVIGVQPFEVWRAPVLLHSPRPLSLLFFPFLVIDVTRRKRNFKILRGGFGIAREITALDNAFSCQLARGWADRDQIREISDPSFSAG